MKSKMPGLCRRHGFCRVVAKHLLALVLLAPALTCALSAQTLLHRYSFVSDASDSVGGVPATVVPPNGGSPVVITNGLTLAGGGGPGFSGYVTLPAGILNTTTNVTVEFWASQNAANGWAEVWSFNSGTASYWAFISDGNNNNSHIEQALRLNNNETDSQSGVGMPATETHYTVTFNAATLVDTIWQGTSPIASATVPNGSYTPGSQNFSSPALIGQDPWPDPQWQGTIYEFRIYSGVLSPFEIAVDDLAGPTNLVTNYTPTSASLLASGTNLVLTGTAQAAMDITLAATGTNIINATSITTNWVSSNPNVLQVNSNGVIVGVGLGSATVSATVNGSSATSPTIWVTAPQTLLHRYSFLTDGSDSVGGANGFLVAGSAPTNTTATINNGLTLPGNTSGGFGQSGYFQMPPGILTNTTSVTIEVWAKQNQGNTWAELWDFANPGSVGFCNFGFIPYPALNGNYMETAFTPPGAGEVDVSTHDLFPNNTEEYLTLTYNNYSLVGKIYTNGILDSSQVFPSTTYCPGSFGASVGGTETNMLGNDIYGDYQWSGTIYEFRIWNGAVTPAYEAAASAAGPSVVITNTTPIALNIGLSTTSMVGAGVQQATVTGNFDQISGVTLTAAATNWVSSNPTVLTVDTNGLITAVNGGSATVSATVNGVTATSASITVATTPPSFQQKPVNTTAAVNDTATLSAIGLGGSLSYQWSFDGNPISGATNATLVLANVGLTNSGTYSVLVSNNLGATNAGAVLNVVQAILLHRYSFVTNAMDSVGAANGTLVAPNGGSAATIDNGLILPGTTSGGFGVSGYVSLPKGILTNTTSLTIETWVTQNQPNTWATIWDFADSGAINFELCPAPASGRNNGNMIAAFTPNNNEADLNTPVTFPSGSEQYVVLTVNASTLLADLYTNGISVGTLTLANSSFLPHNIGGAGGTVQDMLGNDTYGDDQFDGTIYEFRIWDGAVSALYQQLSAAAGPSVVITNLTPTAVIVTVTNAVMVQGQSQPATASANFDQVSGANVTGSITNWTSSNTNILTVSAGGQVTAVGTGSATISATLNGTTGTSSAISVPSSPPIITQQPTAVETLLQGATFSSTIGNIGTSPFVYRWFFNGGATPISTSSNPTLQIPDIQPAASGNYTVLVSNLDGSILSSNVSLTVVPATPYQQTILMLAPVAYWPLDETGGTIAYDVVGGNNGLYTNSTLIGASYALAQPGPTNAFFGDEDYSVQFINSYVDIPEGPFNITGPITVVAWVQLQTTPTFDGIVGHGDQSWRISVSPSGQPGGNDGANSVSSYGSGGDATDPAPSPAINDGNWHMVAYSYNGNAGQTNNGILYVDGAAVGTNTVLTTPPGDNLDVWIGGSPDYGTSRLLPWANLANVAVFSQALTPAQVQGLYQGTFVLGPQTININRSGTNVVLTWDNGTLLQAPALLGPWTTNSAAVSPYTVPATNRDEFFKLLVTP